MASNNDDTHRDEFAETATAALLIGLIVLAAVSLWTQAVITEERFVPALNVIATYLKIPDDVAGATLMAGGASSPELFTSFVALFITHSSLGMGTIIGSEIFNQMIICAGSILSSRKQRLQLSRAIVLREVSFYGLALVLLLVVLRDRRYKDEESEYKSIFIQWTDAYLLLGGYVLYVFVCAYYDRILEKLQHAFGRQDVKVDPTAFPVGVDTSIAVPSLPFLRQISREPRTNFHSQGDLQTVELVQAASSQSMGSAKFVKICESLHEESQMSAQLDKKLSSRRCTFLVDSRMPKPSIIHGLQDVIDNTDGSFSCFLWQQSTFYSKARIGVNAWQLKWFTFRHELVTSVPDRSYMTRFSTYPPFQHIEIDESHLMLQCHPVNSERRNCILMAPSPDILKRVVYSLNQQPRNSEEAEDDHSVSIAEADDMKEQRGPSLVSFPFGASPAYQMLHIFLFPLKALMHWTVPDPRFVSADQLEPKLRRAVMGVIMCIVWLIVGSFAMVTSLEHLGALMRIPTSVVGITISAAGTSLPNYVASVMAARQGLGNQAVSNAFGSNSFNILMGLGLPWAMYTTFYGTYSNLQDDAITMSVLFLAVVLVAFLVLIILSGFVLYRWHAYLFISVYILYLAYAIGQVHI